MGRDFMTKGSAWFAEIGVTKVFREKKTTRKKQALKQQSAWGSRRHLLDHHRRHRSLRAAALPSRATRQRRLPRQG